MGRPRVTFLQEGTDWADDAACLGVHVDFFYPEDHMDYSAPKSVCKRCPVRVECLEYALVNREQHGVWGGMTPKERNKLLRSEGRTRVVYEVDRDV